MNKIFFLLVFSLFLRANEPYSEYAKIFDTLKASEIPSFAEILFSPSLPIKINENLSLVSLNSQKEILNGIVNVKNNIVKSNLEHLAKMEFCDEIIFLNLLKKGVKFRAEFTKNGQNLLIITADKNFCR